MSMLLHPSGNSSSRCLVTTASSRTSSRLLLSLLLFLPCFSLEVATASSIKKNTGIPGQIRLGDIIADLSKPGEMNAQLASIGPNDAFRVTLTHSSTPSFLDNSSSSSSSSSTTTSLAPEVKLIDFEDTAKLNFCDAANNFIDIESTVVVVFSGIEKARLASNPASLRNALGLPFDAVPSPNRILTVSQPSLSVCGKLGMVYSGNITDPSLASVEGQVSSSFFVEKLSSLSNYGTVLDSHYASTAVFPGVAGIAEVAEMDLWCHDQMMIGSVGVRFPDMHLTLFDNWGNPAIAPRTTDHGVVTFRTHPADWNPLPVMASDVKGSMFQGSHFITIAGLVLNGTATVMHRFVEVDSTIVDVNIVTVVRQEGDFVAPAYYQLEMTLVGIHLGGRTTRCRRFQLKPGPPHTMSIEPLGDNLARQISSRNEPVFYVPKAPVHALAVVVRDIFGNPLKAGPACGEPRVELPFFDDFCVQCSVRGAAGNAAAKTTVPSATRQVISTLHASQRENLTTAFFQLGGIEQGMYEVSCVTNASQTIYSLSTATTLMVVPSGDYSCFNGSDASFKQLLTLDDNNEIDIKAIFQDPKLKNPPMARVHMKIPFIDDDTEDADNSRGPNRYGYKSLPADYKTWILLPRKGFVYIPLGLLSVFCFGASYATVSSANLNVTLPICGTANERAIRKEISSWLYEVGDNSTTFYRRLNPAADPAFQVDINMQVCYGQGIAQLEFLQVYCCDREDGRCGSNFENPLAVLLVVGGTVVSLAAGAFSCWYLWSTCREIPVHITNRHHCDFNDKTRVVMAHLWAPFILWAHAYFIFSLEGFSAYVLYYVDVLLPFLWGTVCVIRFLLPLVVFTDPLYRGIGTCILFYTQFLLASCCIWTLCALHLNMKLLPYLVASALALLQVFWSINAGAAELRPSAFKDKVPQHSLVPINAALSMEYYAIASMLFLFALSQMDDLTAFGAVVGAAIILVFNTFWNFSFAASFNDVFKKQFGKDATGASVMEQALVEARKQKMQSEGGALGKEMSNILDGGGKGRSGSPGGDNGGNEGGGEGGGDREMAAVRGSAQKWLGALGRRKSERDMASTPQARTNTNSTPEKSPQFGIQSNGSSNGNHHHHAGHSATTSGDQTSHYSNKSSAPLPVGPAPGGGVVVAPPRRNNNSNGNNTGGRDRTLSAMVAEDLSLEDDNAETDALISQLANSNVI